MSSIKALAIGVLSLISTISIAEAQQAIPRHSSCPSGFNTSGNYCVRKSEGEQAIHRNGSCPSGYNTSGNYCVQSK